MGFGDKMDKKGKSSSSTAAAPPLSPKGAPRANGGGDMYMQPVPGFSQLEMAVASSGDYGPKSPKTSHIPVHNGPSVRPKTSVGSKNNGVGKKGAINVPSPKVPSLQGNNGELSPGVDQGLYSSPRDEAAMSGYNRLKSSTQPEVQQQYIEPVYLIPGKGQGQDRSRWSPQQPDRMTGYGVEGSSPYIQPSSSPNIGVKVQGLGGQSSSTSSSTSLSSVIHVQPQIHHSSQGSAPAASRPKTLGTIQDSTEDKDPDSPGTQSITSQASSTYLPSQPTTPKLDRAAIGGSSSGGKQTLGEIIQQMEAKAKVLLRRTAFVTGEPLADLQYLAHQSRYSSDIGIKRRLIAKLVENGLLDLFVRVFTSVHKVDFYKLQGANGEAVETDITNGNATSKERLDGNAGDKDDLSKDTSQNDDDSVSVKDLNSQLEKYPHASDAMRNLRAVLTCMWNSTDKSPQLCDQCAKRGIIQMLLKELEDPNLAVSELKEHNRIYLVKGYLGILNNVIRYHDKSRETYREAGAVKILQPFLKSSILMVKTKAVMLLSYVINETENDIINATDKNISFMIKMLQSAIESENHYSKKFGYWAVEITAGLNRLASCEHNKERIVNKVALPLYLALIGQGCTEEEQLVAAQGLWTLAFNESCRQKIREDTKCMRGLESLYRGSQREEIRRAARGALWLVEGRLPPSRPTHLQKSSSEGPVVISFQWSSRSVVGKVRERLRSAGYMISTYTDSSGGPSVEVMSQHLEGASVVLVTLSHKYKDSPHCRTEMEIATRLGLDLIPIRAQPRYVPEGWLGALLSDKMCFDFTQETNMDAMISNLIRELANRGHLNPGELTETGSRALSSGSIQQVVAQVHTPAGMQSAGPSGLDLVGPMGDRAVSPGRPFRALGWSADDVAGWLKQNSLAHVTERFKFIDGELLSEMKKMQMSAPESFYTILRQDLRFDLVTTLKFTKALDYL